jgi:Kef-type K+ transport system membrane component KefB
VRGLYASLMLKMFVIIGGLFIYIYGFRGSVNVPALFVAMVLYLVYTSIEVKQLMKIARKKTDD